MMEWQPIETAPKDGTPVLVFVPRDRFVAVMQYKPRHNGDKIGGDWAEDLGEQFWRFTPSHWMPLPEPPA